MKSFPVAPISASAALVASDAPAIPSTVAPSKPNASSGNPKHANHRSVSCYSINNSSDSDFGNANFGQTFSHTPLINGNAQTQPSVTKFLSDNSRDYSSLNHRESFSSVLSDESDLSSLSGSSSQHGSYPSSVTSPSTTRTSPSSNSFSACGSLTQSLTSVTHKNNFDNSHGQPILISTRIFSPSQCDSENYDNPQQLYPKQSVTTSQPLYQNNTSDASLDSPIQQRSQSPQLVTSHQSNKKSANVSNIDPRPLSPATSSRSSTPNAVENSRRKINTPYSERCSSNLSNNSSQASTPSHAKNARAGSPSGSSSRAQDPYKSRASSRASSPASESSRSASRQRSTHNDSNRTPLLPPPPPASKDPFIALQHYLRLLSDTCSLDDPMKKYDVKNMLDEGSSAKVFSAYSLDSPNRDEYAIKVIPLTYSLEFIFNEIFVLQNLKHKNIVNFKESFLRWDGKTREIWIVMEKCARGDVTSRAGKVSPKEVSRIARDILRAFKHLHANGVIHRDIKLSNILMTANHEVKLADFGISSLTSTSTTGMVGTIPYMAPDIVNVGPERPYSTKVDIWSLGVCILELLTGKAAWGRIRDDEIMDRLRRGEKPYGFERLRKKSDIGWETIDFLERCFAKDGEMRWSAEELLEHPFIACPAF